MIVSIELILGEKYKKNMCHMIVFIELSLGEDVYSFE